MNKLTALLFIPLMLFASGCASLVTQLVPEKDRRAESNHPVTVHQVYSGTSVDLIYAKDLVSGTTGMDAAGRGYELVVVPIYLLLDTPLSVAMDTVLLPLTVPKQFIHGDITLENH